MLIPLKAKYRSAHKGRYSGGEKPAPRKNRHKINDKQKAALPLQPKMMLIVDGATGHGVMTRVG